MIIISNRKVIKISLLIIWTNPEVNIQVMVWQPYVKISNLIFLIKKNNKQDKTQGSWVDFQDISKIQMKKNKEKIIQNRYKLMIQNWDHQKEKLRIPIIVMKLKLI